MNNSSLTVSGYNYRERVRADQLELHIQKLREAKVGLFSLKTGHAT